MKLNRFDRFVLVALLAASLANIFSDYITRNYQWLQNILFPAVLLLLIIWVVWVTARWIAARLTAGRYAVQALILNSQNHLLLFYHPYHDKHIPPSGRIRNSEFPDDGLRRCLQERIGLAPSDYCFHEAFHSNVDCHPKNLGNIERVPAPFLVQKELHTQRMLARFHYDFLYVLRLQDENITFADTKYKPIRFVDEETLQELIGNRESFPDVLDAYQRVLSVIADEKRRTERNEL